jgi:hypothetical protein
MHLKVSSKSERRQGFRIPQDRPIKLLEPKLNKYFGGKTHDSSQSGLKIELPSSTPLAVGRIVNLALGNYQSGQGLAHNREMIPAKIVWINRNALVPGKLLAGVQFLQTAAMAVSAA